MLCDPHWPLARPPRTSDDLPLSSLKAPSGAKPELPGNLLVGTGLLKSWRLVIIFPSKMKFDSGRSTKLTG